MKREKGRTTPCRGLMEGGGETVVWQASGEKNWNPGKGNEGNYTYILLGKKGRKGSLAEQRRKCGHEKWLLAENERVGFNIHLQ